MNFTSIMIDIVDEKLGNADPNDYVIFVLKSSDFDRPLNYFLSKTKSSPWCMAFWIGRKLLQSRESSIHIII